MMDYWISADQVFNGFQLLKSHAVLLKQGVVSDIKPQAQINPEHIIRHHDGLISPGFFDIQVNGGGGVLFNNSPTDAAIRKIMAAHHAVGSVAIMPTIITDERKVLEDAVSACFNVKDEPSFLGVHIEGPHISKSRRGTHASEYVRDMDDATLSLVKSLREANIAVLITVAPESVGNSDVKALCDLGAIVSIGHSAAAHNDVQAALDHGVSCFTHLYNAMPPLKNREPGVAGCAIASEVYCSIIVDYIHVDPIMVQLAFNARPKPDRMILISDAMATVGGPDEFVLYGQTLKLQNGRLVNSEGSLAGAHLTVQEALKNLVALGVPLETALRASRHNAAHLLHMPEKAAIVGCQASDLIMLDQQLNLHSVGI